MEFDCTKALGDNLETYLQQDIIPICMELMVNGIVYESQFQTLNSLVCKNNAIPLFKLFSQKTERHIFYSYDKKTCNFVFYDTNVYSEREAITKSVIYQGEKISELYK